MKVSKCSGCPHFKERKWSHPYKPKGYHTIGMTHVYGYCTKYGERCLDIRRCVEPDTISKGG